MSTGVLALRLCTQELLNMARRLKRLPVMRGTRGREDLVVELVHVVVVVELVHVVVVVVVELVDEEWGVVVT